MAKEWTEAEDSVGTIAGGLIPNYHPDLASARMLYVFISEAPKKGGNEVLGRVKKLAGFTEWALEKDFLVEVALDKWNELQHHQRTALVDHLLERCAGEEDEKTGETKWKLREPDVQEFSSILSRHGAWHPQLVGFVSVAQKVDLAGLIEEEEELNLNEDIVEMSESET